MSENTSHTDTGRRLGLGVVTKRCFALCFLCPCIGEFLKIKMESCITNKYKNFEIINFEQGRCDLGQKAALAGARW